MYHLHLKIANGLNNHSLVRAQAASASHGWGSLRAPCCSTVLSTSWPRARLHPALPPARGAARAASTLVLGRLQGELVSETQGGKSPSGAEISTPASCSCPQSRQMEGLQGAQLHQCALLAGNHVAHSSTQDGRI